MDKLNITKCTVEEALSQIDSLENVPVRAKGNLRLLTEEMFSMCKELLNADTMDYEIARDENQFKLKVATSTRVDEEAREQFMSMSSSGKNTANKGIKGILGSILEAFSYEGDALPYVSTYGTGITMTGGDYNCLWSLSQYLEDTPQDQVDQNWDGMEKSIIVNFSDDVQIGVRTGRIEMTVTKKI